MEKEKNHNHIFLLLMQAFHSIITIYFNTFVVAYLLNINGGGFTQVALYYLVAYFTRMVLYSVFSILALKVPKTRMIQASAILFSGLLVYMAFFNERINDSVIIIAFLFNAGNALYWSAYNSISNQLISGKHIRSHTTYHTVIGSLCSLTIPIIFGYMIDYSSLKAVSFVVMGVCIALAIVTILLKNVKMEHRKLDLKGYYLNCYNQGHKRCFRYLYLVMSIHGAREGISTLVTMLIVLTFHTNVSLGIISSVISLISIVLLLATTSIKNNSNKANPYIYLGLCIMTIVSLILLTLNINKALIIAFNICYGGILSIVNRATDVKKSGLIRAVDKKEYIVEHQAVVTFFLNIGRLVFYSILLFASFNHEIWVYKILIGVAAIVILLYGIFSLILEKEYQKILIEKEFNKQVLARRGVEGYETIPSLSNKNEI